MNKEFRSTFAQDVLRGHITLQPEWSTFQLINKLSVCRSINMNPTFEGDPNTEYWKTRLRNYRNK